MVFLAYTPIKSPIAAFVTELRFIADPAFIVIADEPTGNLDPETSRDIMDTFKKINHMGTTVLMVTHDKQMVDMMNKRVIEIVDGKVVRDEQKGAYGDEN